MTDPALNGSPIHQHSNLNYTAQTAGILISSLKFQISDFKCQISDRYDANPKGSTHHRVGEVQNELHENTKLNGYNKSPCPATNPRSHRLPISRDACAGIGASRSSGSPSSSSYSSCCFPTRSNSVATSTTSRITRLEPQLRSTNRRDFDLKSQISILRFQILNLRSVRREPKRVDASPSRRSAKRTPRKHETEWV